LDIVERRTSQRGINTSNQ